MRTRLVTALVALVVVLHPAPSAAQEKPTLDRVEELTREGRTEDARQVLLDWWDGSYAKASRRDVQRALWLRGRLTVDPAQAELDYRRLVIEYPGGPFSDQALLRLAQGAFGQGDSATAAEDVARIGREYPGSATARAAAEWLASAGPAPPRDPDLPGAPPDTVAGATDAQPPDVPGTPPDTLRGVRAQAPDTATAAVRPPPDVSAPVASPPDTVTRAGREPPRERATPRPRFAVQLGAFANRSRAEALRRRAADAGFDARLVVIPGSDLIRVRVGAFDEEPAALAILRQLTDRGFTAAVSRDADLEERVGR